MGPKYIEIYDLVQASPDEYLMHHQIKGAKWGVHRGPPYPLESGIRTKVKKVTNAAKERSKENQAKRAARTSAKKEAASESKRVKADKKETLQDKINKMSDDELRAATNRLKLENAYKEQLPREEKGKSFLQKSSDLLNNLKTAGDAINGLIKTGKNLAKTLGLVEEGTTTEDVNWRNWRNRQPGETLSQYATRLENLSKVQQSEAKFKKAEEAEKRQQEVSEKPKVTEDYNWRNWRNKRDGESVQQYANRLEALAKLQQSEAKLSKAEEDEKKKKGG